MAFVPKEVNVNADRKGMLKIPVSIPSEQQKVFLSLQEKVTTILN